jgi:hypothetical protein
MSPSGRGNPLRMVYDSIGARRQMKTGGRRRCTPVKKILATLVAVAFLFGVAGNSLAAPDKDKKPTTKTTKKADKKTAVKKSTKKPVKKVAKTAKKAEKKTEKKGEKKTEKKAPAKK